MTTFSTLRIYQQSFAAAFRSAQSDISKSGKKFTSKDIDQFILSTRKDMKK